MNQEPQDHLPLAAWRAIVELRLRYMENSQKRIEGYSVGTLVTMLTACLIYILTHGKVTP